MKSKKKYYEILSERKKYRYGIFPFTPKGLRDAKKYIKELEITHGGNFLIKEK